jgi:hypothetical protein
MLPLLQPRVSLNSEHLAGVIDSEQIQNATTSLHMSAVQRSQTACDKGAPLTSDL